MLRILITDDTRGVRQLLAGHIDDFGAEIEFAEDGVEALVCARRSRFDLLMMDINMPKLDGPTAVRMMRAEGNNAPVILVTSHAKPSLIASVLKLGRIELILKPFTRDQVRSTVARALNLPVPSPAQASARPGAGARDLLIVEPRESAVHSLRGMLSADLAVDTAASWQAAGAACMRARYRGVAVSTELRGIDLAAMSQKLRALQKDALFIGLTPRGGAPDASPIDWDYQLPIPCQQSDVDDLMLALSENSSPLEIAGNVLRPLSFRGSPERLPGYFSRLTDSIGSALGRLVGNCFSSVVVDLSQVPNSPELLASLVLATRDWAEELGLNLRLFGAPAQEYALKLQQSTASLHLCSSLEEAQRNST
jgi:CheY-like chemotaxis protein